MSIKYTYPNNNYSYSNLIKNNYRRKSELNFKIVKNGLILPLTSKETFSGQTGGVIDSSGNCIEESLTIRTNPFIKNKFYKTWFVGLNKKPFKDFSNLKIKKKKVIYIGALPAHYGHFIFEGLSRVWIKKLFNPKEFLFVYISRLNQESHLLEIFTLLGIPKENIIKIETPTKFEKIIVPEPSLRLNDYYHEDFRKSVAVNYKQNKKNKKIFFTRSNKNGRSFGQFFIDKLMFNNGYEIINAEKFSLVEICKILQNCSHFASTSGTNMSNSIFLPKGSKVICFNRSSHLHPLQLMIDKMLELDIEYVDCHFKSKRINFSSGPYFFWPSKTFLSFSSKFPKNSNNLSLFARYFLVIIFEVLYYLIYILLRKIKNYSTLKNFY